MKKTVFECINIINDKKRPNVYDIINHVFHNFIIINGDRLYGNDSSILCGIGQINAISVTIIGQLHGHNAQEDLLYNYSMAYPEGYRKAIRSIQQANKFHRPIICFVDTIGAFPGKAAEERGQSTAIAQCIQNLLTVDVPVFTIIIGNGYSGGAIAFCASNKIAMLENALFGVISPMAYSEILWKTSIKSKEFAEQLEMTSWEQLNKGIIDYIIPEPESPNENNLFLISQNIKKYLSIEIEKYLLLSTDYIKKERTEKFLISEHNN